jgi:hypothetical protein
MSTPNDWAGNILKVEKVEKERERERRVKSQESAVEP